MFAQAIGWMHRHVEKMSTASFSWAMYISENREIVQYMQTNARDDGAAMFVA